MSENLYINLTASSHETNIIPNSQVVKEKLNLENLTDLTFLPHAISNNDRLNYLDKEHLKNLIKISPKIQKVHLRWVLLLGIICLKILSFVNRIAGCFWLFLPNFQK